MKEKHGLDNQFKYYGYIAYTHDNYAEARKLHKFLESYKLEFKFGKKGNTLSPVFFDQRDLYGDLNESELQSLNESKYLIIVCSRELKSHDESVNQEIELFLKTHSLDDILLINISKTHCPEKECCPSSLISAYFDCGRSLPIIPNVYSPSLIRNKSTEFEAYAKLISKMTEQAEDTVKSSYKKQKKRERIRIVLLLIISVLITACIILVGVFHPSVSLSVFSGNKWIENTGISDVSDSISFQITAKNVSTEKAFLSILIPDGSEPDKNKESILTVRDSNGNITQINDERVFLEGIDLRKKGIESGDFTCTFSIKLREYYTEDSVVSAIKLNEFYVERETVIDRNGKLSCGWGDSSGGREDLSLEEVNSGAISRVVFNSISDSVIGNEKNFVGVRESNGNNGKANLWEGDEITVEDGKTYVIRMYINNNGRDGDKESTAYNVSACFIIPEYSSQNIPIYGVFSADNATPREYWDGVMLKCDEEFYLEFISGSALLENNGIGAGEGYRLNDKIITDGVLIGYDKPDGIIPAGYQYASYISIEVKVYFNSSTSN